MSNRSLDDSSQELFPADMSRPVIPPTPPAPPPVSPGPTRPRLVQPPELRGAAAGPGAVAPVPPPPPPVAASMPTSPMPAEPAGAGQASASPAGASSLAELRRQRRWRKLKQLPGYTLLESLWHSLRSSRRGAAGEDGLPKRELPAWLVSFVFHLSLILILALIPLAQMARERVELIIGDVNNNGEGAIQFAEAPQGTDIALGETEDLQMSNFANDLPEFKLDMPAIAPSLSPAKSSSELGANLAGMAVEHGLSGRSGSLKGALLAKFGGNATTEAAVNAGLKWLSYQQMSDGGWSLKGPYTDGGANEDRTGATAMALNAFLGAGHSHKSGEYKHVVERGLKFLLRKQDKEGFFSGGEHWHSKMYSQAIATITLCEAYGMTGDSELRTPAAKALKFAEWAQSRQKGWRYEPREDSDLSVTGWYMMAMMTGKMAGLEPSEKTIRSVEEYLEAVAHDYGARYSYQRPDPPTLSMTAEGLLCRQYLGWPSSHPALRRAIEVDLLPNAPDAEAGLMSVYYWYYATQVLHHVGGDDWNRWNEKMRVALPALQVKEGPENGSWYSDIDDFGPAGGRLYMTCFMIYCLEVYYRHLSLYELPPEATKRQPIPSDSENASPANPSVGSSEDAEDNPAKDDSSAE